MTTIIEGAWVQVISAARSSWIFPFTGLQPAQFPRLVRLVAERGRDAIADGRRGRQWALDLPDRVLLVATYWRANLTMRQIGPLVGVLHSPAHRVTDTLGPLLALAPVRRQPVDRVAIDASTRLVIAVGDPQPGNRNDTIVYRTAGSIRSWTGGRSWPTAATAATPR